MYEPAHICQNEKDLIFMSLYPLHLVTRILSSYLHQEFMLTMMWSMPMMMMISDEMLKKELRDIESLLWLMHKIRFFFLYIYLISDDKSVYVKKYLIKSQYLMKTFNGCISENPSKSFYQISCRISAKNVNMAM